MYRTKALLATAALCIGTAASTQAEIIISFDQVGDDVVATVSGSFDTTGLTENVAGASLGSNLIFSSNRWQGGDGANNFAVNNFTDVVEVNDFGGPASNTPATSATWTTGTPGFADSFRAEADNERIWIPDGFNAGDTFQVAGTLTYANQTFATLGLTAGTSTLWMQNQSVGVSGTDGDIRVNVVPEPGSLALMGLGGLCVLRRRRG